MPSNLFCDSIRVRPGREGDDAEALGMCIHDGKRALTDRPGRAQDSDGLHWMQQTKA
jgi:hypothetical protein